MSHRNGGMADSGDGCNKAFVRRIGVIVRMFRNSFPIEFIITISSSGDCGSGNSVKQLLLYGHCPTLMLREFEILHSFSQADVIALH